MKFRWQAILWMFGGLLAAGVIYLAAGQPRGQQITLHPPPTPAPIKVHIVGAVNQPGLYSLPHQSRVQDAVDTAGGLLPEANVLALNLAAYLKDGEQVLIPTMIPTPRPTTSLTTPGAESTPENTNPTYQVEIDPVQDTLININIASQEELETLPGIGPVTAGKIIIYREENGPFQAIEDILYVSGIGPVKFEGIRELITIGG